MPSGDHVKLTSDALRVLPTSVARPQYDRAALSPGIVHIGVGNFHRAHQAWYLHRLMQNGKDLDWGIVGAGVRAYDAKMRERLLAQDLLTTLIELRPDGTSAEVIGSMVGYVPIEEGNGPLIAQMADPAIRIVAMTVTESGYYLDAGTGAFDTSHDDIRHDATHPETPRTAFGAIVAALARRKAAGVGPFTAQSCDNLRGNGDILRQCVVGLARLSDPDLADWIEAKGAFPNSMVDCIVPATGPAEVAQAAAFGIDDEAAVTHENFRQWVIEDHFCAGRPAWDAVGVTFTDRVHDYEHMKIRILNAGHQVLANAGELLGLPMISSCMQDDTVAALFRKVQIEEIVPYVGAVPEMGPKEYLSLIEGRFSNPAILDTVRRVAFDGSSRHPGFLLPILRDALAAGGSVEGLALVEALWARMCAGTRDDGSAIEDNDPLWAELTEVAHAARERPMAWLEQGQFYGDLAEAPAFRDAFCRWLEALWTKGTRDALGDYAKG